jgi:hypothetical protein
MPFVVGILRGELDEVLSLPMDEALVIDLDNNVFIRTPSPNATDDLDLIPAVYLNKLRKVLRTSVRTIRSSMCDIHPTPSFLNTWQKLENNINQILLLFQNK